MTRLALAKTLVQGTVILQGISYSFSASASGTGVADKAYEAKKKAVVTSNSAATVAARASIEKILSANSAVLSDLEITESISNNFKTTVKLFKKIALSSVATTKDGVNYIISKKTTIGAGQWLSVPNDIRLTISAPLDNYGYFELGSGKRSPVVEWVTNYRSNVNNYGPYVTSGDTAVFAGWTNHPGGYIYSIGNFVLEDGAYMNNFQGTVDQGGNVNAGPGNVTNGGSFFIKPGASVALYGDPDDSRLNSYITNYVEGGNPTFCNNGEIACGGTNGGCGEMYTTYGQWLGTGSCSVYYCPDTLGASCPDYPF